jgi:hypothetical protein
MKVPLTLECVSRIGRMVKARIPQKCESCQTSIPRGKKYFYVNHHAIGEHRFCGVCGATFIEQIKAEGAIQ